MAIKLDRKWAVKIDRALAEIQEIRDFLGKCRLCGMDTSTVDAMMDEHAQQLTQWKQHFFTPLQDGRSPDAAG